MKTSPHIEQGVGPHIEQGVGPHIEQGVGPHIEQGVGPHICFPQLKCDAPDVSLRGEGGAEEQAL